MNVKKLFEALAQKGIKDAEYRSISSTKFSCAVLKNEVNRYHTSTSDYLFIDAIIDNKFAIVKTENTSNKNIPIIINDLFETAKYTTKTGALIYKEKAKYRHFNYYNKDLMNVPIKTKIDMALEIAKKLKALNPQLENIETNYDEIESYETFQNTAGIKLKVKSNFYEFSAAATLKVGDEIICELYKYDDNDFSTFNIDKFVKQLNERIMKKSQKITIESKKQNVIIDSEQVGTLVNIFIEQLNADLVLKNTSHFKDKINAQVANKLVTILETPLEKTRNFCGFDDQGVPTTNRVLIKKGVLLTYQHNLETAQKFKVAPTGNASLRGSRMNIASNIVHLKPGKLSKEELINKVYSGVYITYLEGFESGFNYDSGDFSLKAEGFLIKDGKLGNFINMITVTGNLYDIFNNIKAISQNVEYAKKGYYAPCIYLKDILISC